MILDQQTTPGQLSGGYGAVDAWTWSYGIAQSSAPLGTTLFISTDSASGDLYSRSASADTYTRGAAGDGFTKGGGKA